jgi:hypothetical protein
MARGTTLNELVTMVREEAGHSTNATLGQNTVTSLKQKIRRQQEVLWLNHAWPHMRVERDIILEAGDRYYNPPADLSMNHRIDAVGVKFDDRWRPVEHGITMAHYNSVDPELDERRDPVLCWEIYEGNQIEVWPLPETNGTVLRLRGTRNLNPLIANSDTADLDDMLIVMFVAAELAAKQRQDDAQAKLQIAQSHLAKLKAENSKIRNFTVGGNSRAENGRVIRPRPLYGKKV